MNRYEQGMRLTLIGGGVVLLEPKEGLDPATPDDYIEELIDFVQIHDACRLIYDLKNVPIIEKVYYRYLASVESALAVCGVELVVVNMRPAVAFALALWLDAAPVFRCKPDVNSARLGVINK